ncbi:MAG: threonine synthase [Candidatus Asgardarchaeia archaeon]
MWKLICSSCGAEYEINKRIWKCPECGGILDVVNDDLVFPERSKLKERKKTLWRYYEALPVDFQNRVSFCEGFTPLVKSKTFSSNHVFFKLDYLFPTGSFKDRGATIAVTKMREIGVSEFSMDSSGNAGAAFAAYSARAKIVANIFVPAKTSEEKIMQIRMYGANIIKVKGTKEIVTQKAMEFGEKTYYAGHQTNPFFIEGLKTFFYEIMEQNNWNTPDVLVIPVGVGTIILGVFKAIEEFKSLEMIDYTPRIYAVQLENCSPIYDLFYSKNTLKLDECTSSIAEGIAIPNPKRKEQIVRAIKETDGDVILVNDTDSINAMHLIAKEGLFVEPTSATVVAAIKKLIEEGKIDKNEKIVAPLTGFGLKSRKYLH